MKVHGSCHCGAIRFEADADPQKAGVCHCTDCQSLTGSAFALFLQVPKEGFRLTAGQPKIYVKTAESGNRRAQAFCANCGSRLWGRMFLLMRNTLAGSQRALISASRR